MGQSYSGLTKQEIDEYQALTYLTRNEIIKLHMQFCKATDTWISDEVKKIRIQPHQIPELKVNPFRDRICHVFSTGDGLLFDEYIDMMSAFSLNAPKNIKAEYMFRIYDVDGDDLISREDLHQVADILTGTEQALTLDLKEKLVERIFEELDVDENSPNPGLLINGFQHLVSRKPDIVKGSSEDRLAEKQERNEGRYDPIKRDHQSGYEE